MSPKNHNGKGNRCYSSSKLDYSAILFCPPKNASERPNCHKEEQTQSCDTGTSQNETKDCRKVRSVDLPCIRSNFIAAGLQESTVEIIMSSWRDSTKEKYNIYLKKWIEYCSQNSINPFNATTYDGLSFLTYMFQSGNGYSSINSAKSALSALLPVSDGVSFGRQHLVSKFCRGVFQLRPSLPRYAFTWDVKQLFDCYRSLGENSSLKLRALTLKLGTILALLMSQRAQRYILLTSSI